MKETDFYLLPNLCLTILTYRDRILLKGVLFMKLFKTLFCTVLVFVLFVSNAYAAFDSQLDDVESICDFAVEYVNSGSNEVFTDYMSKKIEDLFDDDSSHSDKFVYLFEQDPELTDKEENQLSKIVAVIGDIYVNGGNAELKQSDINKNVIPGYGVDDYENDDAEEFMKVIKKNAAKLSPSEPAETKDDKKNDAMPPEKNESNKKSSGDGLLAAVWNKYCFGRKSFFSRTGAGTKWSACKI